MGWAIGDAQTHGDEGAWDDLDAVALYEVLEREVIPQFYSRDATGIPVAWIARMRESMATLAPQFSSSRAVHEYTQRYYLPGAQEWLRRSADKGAGGQQLRHWRERLDQSWNDLRFGSVTFAPTAGGFAFEAQVSLAALAPEDVAVQLYANGIDGAGPQVYDMTLQTRTDGVNALYRVTVPEHRPAADYTARIVPRLAGAAVPLEANHILWQR